MGYRGVRYHAARWPSFIDSTHVSKAGSDVHFECFDLLPRLLPGVVVHTHDVFFPFEQGGSFWMTESAP
jgi:hypothetical protein